MVPTGTVCLFGTTSEVVDDPDTTHVRPDEIQQLLDNAEPLIPGIRGFRAFRAWAGVRPLYKPNNWTLGKPLPRRHSVTDHADNGILGFFTICGGSLTTHRAMAEDLGDHVCRRFGINAPCETATTPLTARAAKSDWRPAENFQRIERDRAFTAPVCECESVDGAEVIELIQSHGIKHLHDLRRRSRIGFGPCQGTYCGSRVASLIAEHNPDYRAEDDLGGFWTERLKGTMRTAWGRQARQTLLSDAIYRETLGIRLTRDILPAEDHR